MTPPVTQIIPAEPKRMFRYTPLPERDALLRYEVRGFLRTLESRVALNEYGVCASGVGKCLLAAGQFIPGRGQAVGEGAPWALDRLVTRRNWSCEDSAVLRCDPEVLGLPEGVVPLPPTYLQAVYLSPGTGRLLRLSLPGMEVIGMHSVGRATAVAAGLPTSGRDDLSFLLYVGRPAGVVDVYEGTWESSACSGAERRLASLHKAQGYLCVEGTVRMLRVSEEWGVVLVGSRNGSFCLLDAVHGQIVMRAQLDGLREISLCPVRPWALLSAGAGVFFLDFSALTLRQLDWGVVDLAVFGASAAMSSACPYILGARGRDLLVLRGPGFRGREEYELHEYSQGLSLDPPLDHPARERLVTRGATTRVRAIYPFPDGSRVLLSVQEALCDREGSAVRNYVHILELA